MSNTRRIVKNTFFLYIRMFFILIVSLYTSRVVLEALGVVDFGIYSVVAGFVSMLTFLTNTMSSASQRFLAYDIGRKDNVKLNQTFNLTVLIYVFFVLIIIILAETIGLYFVQHELNVPSGRRETALWVYQFSVLSFIITVLRIPLNSLIIAYEKMSFYAWVSIIEVFLKLLVVYLLFKGTMDRLLLYGILTSVVSLLITIFYQVYVTINFKSCFYSFHWDLTYFKRISFFAGWNMFDSIANVAKNQGINILLNIFFNPVVNAARAIAYQVGTQITSFVGNMQIAVAPQMTKYYSVGEIEDMKVLYFNSSRWTFYLFYFIGLPFYFLAPTVLNIWLVEVPENTLVFTQLFVINIIVDCIGGTSNLLIHATGEVKKYKIVSGFIMFLNLPISYVFLSLGFSVYSTSVIAIVVSAIIIMARLFVIQSQVGIAVRDFLVNVVVKELQVLLIGSVSPILYVLYVPASFMASIGLGFICLLSAIVSIYFVGLSMEERKILVQMLLNKVKTFYK